MLVQRRVFGQLIAGHLPVGIEHEGFHRLLAGLANGLGLFLRLRLQLDLVEVFAARPERQQRLGLADFVTQQAGQFGGACGRIEPLDQRQTGAARGLLLQALAIFGQAVRLFTDGPLGGGEAPRQRAVEAFAGLLALLRIETGSDAFGQLQTERLAGEQRRRIQEVLTEIKCRDLTVGERFLSPIVTRDEDDGGLYVRLIDGELAPLTKDSADSVLPDYLKLTEVLGGAGSVNGSTKKQETQKELDTARKELDRLANVARQTNTNSDIQKYQRQKRVVQQIEANVKNAR